MLARRAAQDRPQVDISFPEIEKFDHLPPASVDGASASSRSWKAAPSTAAIAWCPTPAAKRCRARSTTCWPRWRTWPRAACAKRRCWGRNVNGWRGAIGAGGDENDDGDVGDFALLLEAVAAIGGIDRIRYTTSHPNEFTQRLVDVYARVPQLVNHVHLPVQHGSDRLLAAMKRGYTAMEFKSTVRKLRAVRPGVRISSDFIVGFPGETDDDFERLMKLVDDIGFDHSFSFLFSARPGTPAAALADDTPHEVKLARCTACRRRSRRTAGASANRWSEAFSASWSKGRRARTRTN